MVFWVAFGCLCSQAESFAIWVASVVTNVLLTEPSSLCTYLSVPLMDLKILFNRRWGDKRYGGCDSPYVKSETLN